VRQIAEGQSIDRDAAHNHAERPHQGKGTGVLLPAPYQDTECAGSIRHRERLGGLLKY
jgi:hypothetical protein